MFRFRLKKPREVLDVEVSTTREGAFASISIVSGFQLKCKQVRAIFLQLELFYTSD